MSTGSALPPLTRFARYCAVGGLGTLLHFGATIALVEGAHVAPVPASVAGFLLALAVSFVLNRSWVFRSTAQPLQSGVKYAVVSVAGLALNTLLMTAITVWLGWSYLWGLALVVAVVPITNYTLNRRWAFAPPQR